MQKPLHGACHIEAAYCAYLGSMMAGPSLQRRLNSTASLSELPCKGGGKPCEGSGEHLEGLRTLAQAQARALKIIVLSHRTWPQQQCRKLTRAVDCPHRHFCIRTALRVNASPGSGIFVWPGQLQRFMLAETGPEDRNFGSFKTCIALCAVTAPIPTSMRRGRER